MAVRGRGELASRARARPENVVVPIVRSGTGGRFDAVRLVPSGRSILLAFAVLAVAVCAWYGARETSVFAVRRFEVSGAPPGVASQVRARLQGELGTSLLELDVARTTSDLNDLPTVVSTTLDRAFPQTLRIAVVPERAVMVVRQGSDAWLVSARGRVMSRIERGTRRTLPRLWVKRDLRIELGATLAGDLAPAIAAAGPLSSVRLPPVATVRTGSDELSLALRSGLLLRLGEPDNIRLKLAIAARIVPLLDPEAAYLDVSVPDRPVSGTTLNSQVEVENTTSTTT
jgi:cell division septal protein FtsQ